MSDNRRPSDEYVVSIEDIEEMSWDDIERIICDEIDAAIKFQKQSIAPNRSTNWDRYYGRPLGNEVTGKSKYMSRDLLETIEWILPNLIKLFASADHKVKLKVHPSTETFEDQPYTPEQIGKALMDRIYKDLYADESLGLFTVLYTWFKDALVSGSAFAKVFWEVDTALSDLDTVVEDWELDELNATKEVTLTSIELLPTGQTRVKGEIERISKDQLVADNIPHWEFIFEEHTRSMNDDTGKGFSTVVTLDYLKRINQAYSEDNDDFFYNLDLIDAVAANQYYYDDDSERKRFMNYEVLNEYVGKDAKGPKRRIQLTEWHTRQDVNGDGFLEDIKVWRANGIMIRWELNGAHFIPCSKLSPILDPYKFQGIAYADLIVELQNLKTALMRKMLDNFDLQNSGRWFFKNNTSIDMERFLKNIPGDAFNVNPDHIKNMAPSGFDQSQLSLLEYIEGIKENRTGSTRYNQGTDSSSLNQTAHGIQTIMSASMKRIELIGTLFAEGGLKDFFKKSALLTQQNLAEPFLAKINGETVEITPEMIQGTIEAYVDLGTEDQAGQIESQRLLQMSAVLFDLNSKFPGLITPEKARNIAAKYVAAMGFDSDNYLASTTDFMQATQRAQQMQETIQQMQMMMERMKLQMEREEVDIKKITAFGEIAQAQEDLKAKLVIESAKLKAKEGETFQTRNVDLFKEIFGAMSQVRTSNEQPTTEQKQLIS